MNRNSIIIVISVISVAVIIGAAVGGYLIWSQGSKFTVVFRDSKYLQPGANVYLSGVVIGTVKAVDVNNSGGVNVVVRLSDKNISLSRASQFFIDTGYERCLMVKTSSKPALPIANGDVLEGTDSFLMWQLLDVVDQIQDVVDSPQARKLRAQFKQCLTSFSERLRQIDWDKIGNDVKVQVESLVDEIDRALQSQEFQQSLEQIKEKIKNTQNALIELKNSEEATRLYKDLQELYNRINERHD